MSDDATQPATPPRPPATSSNGLPSWAWKAIAVGILVVLLVITYFILAAFAPREWAQHIGTMVDGSITSGTGYGLAFGFVCTFVSLVLLVPIWWTRRWRGGRYWAIGLIVLAVIVSIPNLLTLSIVAGNSSAAHAGERILDVDGPGFRGATLAGVILAVAVFAVVFFLVVRVRRRRKAPSAPTSGTAPTTGPSAG
ncbi:permease [Gordonia sp. NPDC003504]|jgi:hypothetical protein